MAYTREFTPDREAQGFRSQAHLDAFFRSLDHERQCTTCSTIAGHVHLLDGPQPLMGQCDIGRTLFDAVNEAKQTARTTTPTIGDIILQQLGGARFSTMVGARQFLTMSHGDQDGPGLQFTIGRNQSRANKVRITLEATDTYTVTFLRVTRGGLQVELMAVQSNVFAEMLTPVFERVTGFATHL